MKISRLIFLCIVVVIAAILFVSKIGNKPGEEKIVLSSQTSLEDSVSVVVTPKNVSQPAFEIVLDTHAGSLDEDLTKNSMLIDDLGNVQNPTGWEGDPAGGHHRKGVLQFSRLSKTKTITLKIQNIGQVKERSFTWSIERSI